MITGNEINVPRDCVWRGQVQSKGRFYDDIIDIIYSRLRKQVSLSLSLVQCVVRVGRLHTGR